MRFWTVEEGKRHAPQYDFGWTPLETEGVQGRPHHLRADFRGRPWTDMPVVLHAAIDAVGPCDWWLVWMDPGPGQWPGGPLHLYERLRLSYGDARLLHEAPCHFFHRHERADLMSFLQVGVLSLWDIHVVTDLDYGRLFVSHSEWLNVTSADDPDRLRQLLQRGDAGRPTT